MGTEVLRPQDCLIERFRVPPTACPRRRYGNGSFNPSYYYAHNNNNGNARFNRKPAQKKRVGSEQQVSKKYGSTDDLKTVRNNVTMEKVTILRRGESLDTKIKSIDGAGGRREDGLIVTGTDRLGPDPEMVPKQINIVDIKSSVTGKSDVYAGSAFFVSPAPSSLPLPSFSKKKEDPVDNSATKGLRRLLRLDL
ncbi:hypothetical protein F3Y22_tig00000218pilonHSYRG00149 [Hibiscus syriacus]|uniref:Uncharacterized protein n=1 Tax=Hibiscus syriacus TaxID=106335 RepID=A0A6A3D5S0_HIBSY|nr:uncharacterized protein LOC120153797 [Hibiscus syriacus]KAE8736007.1 hypothetical protein F3Y22_tig00000218pilonHSYRG00149 [Hibiscus syriacus]